MGKQFQLVLKIKTIKNKVWTHFLKGMQCQKKILFRNGMCAHVHNHKLFQAYESNP